MQKINVTTVSAVATSAKVTTAAALVEYWA